MNGTNPRRTKAELEARRRLAVQRVTDGWPQKDVAAFLGVHPVTVAKWVAAYRAAGEGGLAAKPTPGRPRFLTPDQEARVLSWLLRKPTEFGFRTDLRTAARGGPVDPRAVRGGVPPELPPGVAGEPGPQPQKPARRPKQRDPVEIDRWLSDDYPVLEKKSGGSTPTSC